MDSAAASLAGFSPIKVSRNPPSGRHHLPGGGKASIPSSPREATGHGRACLCTRTHSLTSQTSRGMQLLGRHLSRPTHSPIAQKSDRWSQFYGASAPFARDLTMNSQTAEHSWKGCGGDYLNLVTCSYRNHLATRDGRRKSEASLTLHSIHSTLVGQMARRSRHHQHNPELLLRSRGLQTAAPWT